MSNVRKAANWPLIAVAYITLFSLGLLDNSRAPFFPDITVDLRLSDTLASLFFAVASTVAYFSGRVVPDLTHRMGLMNVVRLGQILMAVGFASISFSQGLISLVLTCAVFGYGFGLLNVAQNLMIVDGAQGRIRRRLFSGLHAMYAFSSLIAPLVAAQLYRFNIRWQQAYLGLSVVALIGFVASFFAQAKDAQRSEPREVLRAPHRGSYFVVGSMVSFYILAEIGLSSRLTLYLRRVFDYSPDAASVFLALFFVFLFFGRMIFLIVPFKASNLKIIEWSLISSFFAYALGLWAHPGFLILCGLTMSPVFALSMELITEKYPSYSTDAIATCLAISCVYIVTMHFVLGMATDLLGIRVAMTSVLAFLFVSWVLLKWMERADNLNVKKLTANQ